jgi:4-hydroxy-4-methyl-2-oxoglutarate aldolase
VPLFPGAAVLEAAVRRLRSPIIASVLVISSGWLLYALASQAQLPASSASTKAQIAAALLKASTGNIADAVDEATGHRGFMFHDMKPVFRARIAGPASTAILRPVLKTDKTEYPNYQIQILDEAEPGNVLVYVLEDGLETAGIGNLMSTTAKVRGLAGAVIDGGARDIEEIEQIGFPVWSRSVTPATSVGRYVSVAKQVPVTCAGVTVRPGDWVVGDRDGVVAVPVERLDRVLELIRQYDDKETKMVPLIREAKSMMKALAIFNRY